jgi:uncharacterized protein YcbK (DUF882 family)
MLFFARTLSLCLALTFTPGLLGAQTGFPRFFLMGDGKIEIRNSQTGREAKVGLLSPDGTLDEEAFCRIDEVFGFPTKEKAEHISPRLIFMLDYFSDIVAGGKVIHLDSGYRSPEYNTKLRNGGANAAKTSTHIDGMALDFNIQGVSGKKLWELIKSKDCCGIGHYGGANVHLDSAKPRFWEAATSKVRTGESEENRRIYVSSDFDRYRAGETVRLSFSSVSDFGFGVKPTVTFVRDPEGSSTVATAPIRSHEGEQCVILGDRKASRFLYVNLPPGLREGRYRIKVEFCRKTSDQMPLHVISNELEIAGKS